MAKKTHRQLFCDKCKALTDHHKITTNEFTDSLQANATSSENPKRLPVEAVSPQWLMIHGKPYKCHKCATIRTVKAQHHDIF